MFTGKDRFVAGTCDLGFSVLDFWQYAYSELNSDPRYDIAEYLVSIALELTEAYNRKNWTLFDILYPRNQKTIPDGYRIEVKCTGYYQTWRTDGKVSQQRAFSIRKVHDENGVLSRHSDVYVFCLLNGNTREEANPLDVDNWAFYMISTHRINEECGENKSISLQRIKHMSPEFTYAQIKREIDRIVDLECDNVSHS